ncbi:unnamed protein product [Clonostachys rosea f. rosea IK726]|uniref:Uncharacterized protein n=1 Tax=Clonostachys rosea f. rosea IK726 TaxID=1349383 RepID=A0ACA9UPL6_BIOOC|nr:unnamed protein product [Clonostachys rosea f. rosea IK726]
MAGQPHGTLRMKICTAQPQDNSPAKNDLDTKVKNALEEFRPLANAKVEKTEAVAAAGPPLPGPLPAVISLEGRRRRRKS